MKKFWLKLVAVFGLSLIFLTIASASYIYWSVHKSKTLISTEFVIEPGSGVKRIARNLVEQNILQEPYAFIFWAYWQGHTKKIHAGEYSIGEQINIDELLRRFVQGDVIKRSITFVEGWRFKDLRDALSREKKLIKKTLNLSDQEVMAQLGLEDIHPEGQFFPDTYQFTSQMSDLDILLTAYNLMQTILDEEWEKRSQTIHINNKYETLILASIVEKETGQAEERGLIASVFHNRLQKRMRLQTDPTVIYGLGDSFDGNLTRKHLRTDTPYNTYTRHGLPPTPIAMPGKQAIKAVLHPETSKALFFVSKGDGTHYFSQTLEEHNQAVIKYQLKGKKQTFSSNQE